jgi:hypothetical protein
VLFAVLTFTVSWLVVCTTIDRGPIGRSDSGEGGDLVRLALGLGVRVDLLAAESSASRCCACFLARAIILLE